MAAFAPAHAKKCPQQVKSAIDNAYPGAKLESCKSKSGMGHMGAKKAAGNYHAKLDTKDAKEVDLILAPDGAILVTEQALPTDSVPAVVITAFQTDHPDAKMNTAMKQTDSAGVVIFEIGSVNQGNPLASYYDQNGKKVKEDSQRQSMRGQPMKSPAKTKGG